MGVPEKLLALHDVLQTRLRYMKRWDGYDVSMEGDEISITWLSKDNPVIFEKITYPASTLSDVIRKQKAKLLRDIPANELNVYKEVVR